MVRPHAIGFMPGPWEAVSILVAHQKAGVNAPLGQQFDQRRRRDQQTDTGRHASEDQLPRREPDLLTLAIVISKHLIDMRELLADIQLVLVICLTGG